MEIERKWLVESWPKNLKCLREHKMEQGYISTKPTVRIRKEHECGKIEKYILCFKAGGGLSREEIEMPLTLVDYENLRDKILRKPMIVKTRRDYLLPDGNILEVNEVDKGASTEFYYAEIEFKTEESAKSWFSQEELAKYLEKEVTYERGQSMADYWLATR